VTVIMLTNLTLPSSASTGARREAPTARMVACGRIDDGGEFPHAVHAEIGNGARAALIFGRFELLGAGALGEIADIPPKSR